MARAAQTIMADELLARDDTDLLSPWNDVLGWRMNLEAQRHFTFKTAAEGELIHYAVNPNLPKTLPQASVLRAQDALQVILPDRRYDLIYIDPHHYESADGAPQGRLTALMPGRIVALLVKPGEAVTQGQPLLIMEAMKMQHTIVSPKDGVIERIAFKENDLVQADALLFAFAEP